jgi:hypothetical protein
MPVRMKALKSFMGEKEEMQSLPAGRNSFMPGDEFHAHDGRAGDYERMGHAVPVVQQKSDSTRKTKVEPALKNKAASDGPLRSRGGKTGAAKTARSSRQGRARPSRTSKS